MSVRPHSYIKQAYRIIGELTPLPVDCGQLCGGACCKGDELGMLLFPGEAAWLSDVPGFHLSRIRYMDGRAWLLCCDGTCNRELRPLSCRIFPLAPLVEENGIVTAVPDPRARRLCPLAGGEHLDRRFVRAVSRVFSLLAKDERQLAFLRALSAEIEELRRITG